jgi:hypothetical protein
VTDAVLGNGLFDHAGNLIQPPPYIDIPTYEATIHLLRQLAPARLLTAHYPIIEGDGVECFLTESEAFVARARAAVTDALTNAGESDLIGLLAPLNDVLGPFATMSNELAGPVRAHLRELVAIGRAEEVAGRRPPVWRMVR